MAVERNLLDKSVWRSHWFWRNFTAWLIILMELSWLLPWYRTVMQASYAAAPLRIFVVLGGLMLAAYLVTTLIDVLRLLPTLQRIIQGVLLFASLIIASRLLLASQTSNLVGRFLNPDQGTVLVTLVALWLWWRAINLARDTISPALVWRRFWLGLVMLVAYYLIFVPNEREPTEFGLLALFLGSGLLAMVAARVAYISRYHGMKKSPFGQYWLAVTALTVGGVVSAATILASLLTGQFSNFLNQLALGIRGIVIVVIFILSIPWLVLSIIFGTLLDALLKILPAGTSVATEVPGAAGVATQVPYLAPEAQVTPLIPPLLVSLIFWVVIIALGLAFIINTRAREAKINREENPDMESLLDSNDLLQMLKNALKKQLKDAGERLVNASLLTRRQRLQAEATVRRIYAQLLDLTTELECPRPAAATPLEFLPHLQNLLPASWDDLALLTQSYVKVRYGELPESQAEVDALEMAWKRIALEGQELKKILRAKAEYNKQMNL